MMNMRICYISYTKYGTGSWVHTSQFVKALKNIHDDVIVHTPFASQITTDEDEKPDRFEEVSQDKRGPDGEPGQGGNHQ